VSELLYQHNAILRLVRLFHRQECLSIFVQEQIVTLLSRLANKGFEAALIAQNAIPILLRMLIVRDPQHPDYSKRIRYKATVCIGTIASTGIGLKALHENGAHREICKLLCMEEQSASPLRLICSSIKQKLEYTYESML